MWNIETYPSNKYSPVGVVLIPGTHNVYGDGSCCVMSLKEMNCTTPDDGSTSYKSIYWGGYGTDIPSLANYNQVCYVGSNGVVNETVQGVTSSAYLPSDKFSNVNNPYDTDTSYYYNDSDTYVPSPYNDNDTRNTEYYRTSSPSSSANAMSDFNGKENTKIITDLATAQSDWRTAATITNDSSNGYYPAACCCWRYHTEGTKQGDWYLPSCGELGYIMPKFNKINEAITKLINGYGSNFGVVLLSNHYYWSSSEYSRSFSRYVETNNGSVGNSYKNDGYYVRACVRVR